MINSFLKVLEVHPVWGISVFVVCLVVLLVFVGLVYGLAIKGMANGSEVRIWKVFFWRR